MKLSPTRSEKSENANQTRLIGLEFAGNLPPGTVLNLIGDLGAGKTEFVKGLAIGLGFDNEVTSPTLDEVGFDDYLIAGGICAIEWGNKFPNRLPADSIAIRFIIHGNDRRTIVW